MRFPYLGAEKFKELARRYTYTQGRFLIRRSEITTESLALQGGEEVSGSG